VRNVLVGFATAVLLVSLAVLVPSTLPPGIRDTLGLAPSPLGTAPRVGGEGSYRFMQHQLGDARTPVTYSPCEPIRVEINPAGVEDEDQARELVLSAMERVSRATGLRLQYAGPSSDRPRWRSATEPILGRADPVLISFATSDEVSELEGRVAGVGGSASLQRHGTRTYVSGQVTLDADTIDELLRDTGGPEIARAIAMHELGHLVGLAHVDDERELMNAQNRGQLDFGPGDLRGLAELGRGPCV
jgi:hypothetical protein